MAEMNLLKGSYTGKLGETVGAAWKGKQTVRSKIWSKAPPTDEQTKSVRSFECLNRLSSAISKIGFKYLPVSSKNMHQHNAVSQLLKPIIKNKKFEPENIKEIIQSGNDAILTAWTINRTTGEANIQIKLTDSSSNTINHKLFVLVFDDTGKTHFAECVDFQNYRKTIYLDIKNISNYTLMSFISKKSINKIIMYNLILKRGAGMKYSRNEQPTGDLWINSKPIYQTTFYISHGTIQSGTSSILLKNIEDIDDFIESKIVYTGSSFQQNTKVVGELTLINTANSPPTFTQNTYMSSVYYDNNTKSFYLRFNAGNQIGGFNCYATVYYTKKSDQPVSDG